MELRTIANTKLSVSPLCLGTMTFGTPVGEKEAIRIVHHSLEKGLNFFDTANMYEGYNRYLGSPGGVAEKILGKALKGKYESCVVATKVGMKIGPSQADQGLSRKHIIRECERSLKRLGIDRIDLYYMHKPDPGVSMEESIEAFDLLVQEGKIKYWGLSNFDAEKTKAVLHFCDANQKPRPVANQPAYSLLNRGIEKDLLPLCKKNNLSVFPYQVLQGGVLTGKYADTERPPKRSRADLKPEWLPQLNNKQMLEQLKILVKQAKEKNRSILEHTLIETLKTNIICSLIVGVTNTDQLNQIIGILSKASEN